MPEEYVVYHEDKRKGEYAFLQFFPNDRWKGPRLKHPHGQGREFFEQTGGLGYKSSLTMVNRARSQICEECCKLRRKGEELPDCMYIKFRPSLNHRRELIRRRKKTKK